ncbi:MAG: thioredoxin-disulfide reductase [Treponema sp. CETP13]|nr:MAG: thioredoxin-disulfide reductase [Treponema sp. CETP13]
MENDFYDFIIIGAGVAGLTAAQYASRANLSALVIDPISQGGQVEQIIELENYPGIYPAISGFDFIKAMTEQTLSFGAKIIKDSVISIDKPNDKYLVKTKEKEFESHTLLIATGAFRRQLNVPGENEFVGHGVSYCATCDGPFFKNRRIAVIGGGDAACDEATYLATLSDKVTLIHRKGQLRAQKGIAERVLRNPNITVMFNSIVKEIKGDTVVKSLLLENSKTHEESNFETDGVFVFIGMIPRSELVENLPKDEAGYIITNEKMETKFPGMYVAGDIRSKSFRQIVTACADGAIAANSARSYISELNEEVYK